MRVRVRARVSDRVVARGRGRDLLGTAPAEHEHGPAT